MKFPREVFREYDVRGVVGEQLTDELAHALGCAIGSKVVRALGERSTRPTLVVGRDHRPSGVSLATQLNAGICRSGCDVIDIGVTPTPVGYWAIHNASADGGVQITGSHNPANYNGFKITLLGHSIHGDDIIELRDSIESNNFVDGVGQVEQRDVLPEYLADLQRRLQPAARPMKVVVDAGNGTGALTSVPLYRALGYEVVPLFCELDGTFPNHHPDPTVEENLEDLRTRVRETGADLGLAFDGDGDRIGVIDADGEVVWGDRLLIVLARQVLEALPGAPIIGEVKCSKTLYDDIRKHGGEPVMWRTGHSLIKAKMKAIDAPLAGEMSGHIFFAHRYLGFDDATYAGARLLEILSSQTATIGELLADVPQTFTTPEIRVDCPEAQKFSLVEAVKDHFTQNATQLGAQVVDIDGVRVEWPDGWGLVRPSNTQPILVLRFEAQSQERMQEIRALFEAQIAVARPAD